MATKKEVQAVINRFKFERYGRVNLPYGLHTKGLDRTPTRDFIFPDSLKGKTVFDIGAAYGYLCFEAEKLGASEVVGVEAKPGRFKRAMLFKDLLDSKVDFIRDDIVTYEFSKKYDYIIILNVLHHLKIDLMALLEKLAQNTNEKLIIESPSLKRLDMPLEDALGTLGFSNVDVSPSLLDGPEAGSRQIFVCQK